MKKEITQNAKKSVPLSSKTPKIIQEVGFDFDWDSKKVWALKIPTVSMPIKHLLWHFDIPFWEKQHTNNYNLTPYQVIEHPTKHPLHYNKIKRARLKYPIDIMKNKGRWLILDGLHRLTKAHMQGLIKVQVRKIPRKQIPLIISSKSKK